MPETPKPKPATPIERSDRFVVCMQLEVFCIALRLAVQMKEKPGKTALALLNKYRGDVLAIVAAGRCKDSIPEVDDAASAIDVLALAESLRGTILAFLSPEESQEQRGTFGFSTK